MKTFTQAILKNRKGLWVFGASLVLFFMGGGWIDMRYENQIKRIKEQSAIRQILPLGDITKISLDASLESLPGKRVQYVNIEFNHSVKDVVLEFNKNTTVIKSEVKNGIFNIGFLGKSLDGSFRSIDSDSLKLILPAHTSGIFIKGFSGISLTGGGNIYQSSMRIDLLGCGNRLAVSQIALKTMMVNRHCGEYYASDEYSDGIHFDHQSDIQSLSISSPGGRITIDDDSRIGSLTLQVGERVSITAPVKLLQKASLQTGSGHFSAPPAPN